MDTVVIDQLNWNKTVGRGPDGVTKAIDAKYGWRESYSKNYDTGRL